MTVIEPTPGVPPADRGYPRPAQISSAAVLLIISGVFRILSGFVVLIFFQMDYTHGAAKPVEFVILVVQAISTIGLIGVGVFLMRGKKWARGFAIAISLLIIALTVLSYLVSPYSDFGTFLLILFSGGYFFGSLTLLGALFELVVLVLLSTRRVSHWYSLA